MEVEVLHYSVSHIHGQVSMGRDDDQKWMFLGIYEHPLTTKKMKTWDLIHHLKPSNGSPWLVLGNFNEILDLSKKHGGRDRNERQMENFRDVLNDCTLCDLGFSDLPFTWYNNREGHN